MRGKNLTNFDDLGEGGGSSYAVPSLNAAVDQTIYMYMMMYMYVRVVQLYIDSVWTSPRHRFQQKIRVLPGTSLDSV